MAITALSTDWGTYPRIIRVTTTDSLSTVLTAGYITAQSGQYQGASKWRISMDSGRFSFDSRRNPRSSPCIVI